MIYLLITIIVYLLIGFYFFITRLIRWKFNDPTLLFNWPAYAFSLVIAKLYFKYIVKEAIKLDRGEK